MSKKYQPTYWGDKGKYQKEYEMLHNLLVPNRGDAISKQGQFLRAVSNLYYQRYNNGWGNPIGQFTSYIRKYVKAYKLNICITQAMPEKDFDKAIDKVIEHLLQQPLVAISESDKFCSE